MGDQQLISELNRLHSQCDALQARCMRLEDYRREAQVVMATQQQQLGVLRAALEHHAAEAARFMS